MEKVIFDFSLRKSQIKKELDSYDYSKFNEDELKGIAMGKMYIFFETQREYIILETGMIDYLIQIRDVIQEIKNGNYFTFSVSCDYYSNSLGYEYDDIRGVLTIVETNNRLFKISTNFLAFKKGFEKFPKMVITELELEYPELLLNEAFISIKDSFR